MTRPSLSVKKPITSKTTEKYYIVHISKQAQHDKTINDAISYNIGPNNHEQCRSHAFFKHTTYYRNEKL
jgi:hypothetical protein